MTVRVAINGYGRIGRNVLRALYDGGYRDHMKVVAINDPSDIDISVLLTKHDTVHGKFKWDVSRVGDDMLVDGDTIHMFAERDPSKLPWAEHDVDVVLECTGIFASREKAKAHIDSGAKKVVISAPAGKDVDATIVYGVNHETLKADHTIISNASCTTNCLAPMVKPLHDALGIESGLMTTIHSYTNDQKLIDVFHKDPRRARSATQSMIPTKTGAAAAVGLVLPELAGKLDGYAVRVPTINVSLVDLTFESKKETTVEEVNAILEKATQGTLKGILEYSTEPLVSMDFNHCSASCTIDAELTKVIGRTVKVTAWYDNEWGFSNRMLDTTMALMQAH